MAEKVAEIKTLFVRFQIQFLDSADTDFPTEVVGGSVPQNLLSHAPRGQGNVTLTRAPLDYKRFSIQLWYGLSRSLRHVRRFDSSNIARM